MKVWGPKVCLLTINRNKPRYGFAILFIDSFTQIDDDASRALSL